MSILEESFDPVASVAAASRPASPIGDAEEPAAFPTITVGEAARMFSVSEGTIARWADNGTLNHIRTPGNHRRIDKASAVQLRLAQLDAGMHGTPDPLADEAGA